MKFKHIMTLTSALAINVVAFEATAHEELSLPKQKVQSLPHVELPTFKANDFKHNDEVITDGYVKIQGMKAIPEFLATPSEVAGNQGEYALINASSDTEIQKGLFAGDVLRNSISGGLAVVTGNIAVHISSDDNLSKLTEQLGLTVVKDLGIGIVIVKSLKQVELKKLEAKIIASGLVTAAKLERLENLNQAF
ncbi:hypothetical protein D1819_13525 [Pseudoalteromonas tunicata]|nr:hypothetical protein D1819_13525 [Pseudoalteromonas tunicata]